MPPCNSLIRYVAEDSSPTPLLLPPSLQAGVFVSRSSVGVLPIRRVEVFTVLQLINMLLWMLQAWVSQETSCHWWGMISTSSSSSPSFPVEVPSCLCITLINGVCWVTGR